MECAKCKEQWQLPPEMESKVKSCPFCGAEICVTPAESSTFTEVVPCFKYIFKTYGADIIEHKGRFFSLLTDFLPSMDDEKRLIKMALDSGAYQRLYTLNQSDIESQSSAVIMLLTDKFFVGREYAEKAVNWLTQALYDISLTATQAPAQVAATQHTVQPASTSNTPIKVRQKFLFFTDIEGNTFYGIYEGETLNGKRHGYGTQYDENDIIYYQGEWKDDMRHGQGMSYYSNGKMQYHGEWKDDKLHGQGTVYNLDGNVWFEGEWKGNIRHGQGTQYRLDGTIWYKGEFKDGKRHGQGTSYHTNGKIEYQGLWIDGEPADEE